MKLEKGQRIARSTDNVQDQLEVGGRGTGDVSVRPIEEAMN